VATLHIYSARLKTCFETHTNTPSAGPNVLTTPALKIPKRAPPEKFYLGGDLTTLFIWEKPFVEISPPKGFPKVFYETFRKKRVFKTPPLLKGPFKQKSGRNLIHL